VYPFIEFFSRHTQILARLTTLVLIVLITVSVADTALFAVDNLAEPSVTPVDPIQPIQPSRNTKRVSIADFNLFGVVEQKSVPDVLDAPETKLNLELKGVFTAENEDDSTAIVAEANKVGELYQIGDKLPGNATLSAVYDDHILFKRGTRYERLNFSDDAFQQTGIEASRGRSGTARPQRRNTSSSQRIKRARERQEQLRRSRNTQGARTGGKQQNSISDIVKSYRDKIDADPQSVLKDLGMESVAEGEASGYRVGNQISQKQLLQAGLQSGDVILSVNGRPVGDVMQDKSMVDQAMAAGRVKVEIQRRDRRFSITVPVR
jgi:general secretion pathway protein C